MLLGPLPLAQLSWGSPDWLSIILLKKGPKFSQGTPECPEAECSSVSADPKTLSWSVRHHSWGRYNNHNEHDFVIIEERRQNRNGEQWLQPLALLGADNWDVWDKSMCAWRVSVLCQPGTKHSLSWVASELPLTHSTQLKELRDRHNSQIQRLENPLYISHII